MGTSEAEFRSFSAKFKLHVSGHFTLAYSQPYSINDNVPEFQQSETEGDSEINEYVTRPDGSQYQISIYYFEI